MWQQIWYISDWSLRYSLFFKVTSYVGINTSIMKLFRVRQMSDTSVNTCHVYFKESAKCLWVVSMLVRLCLDNIGHILVSNLGSCSHVFLSFFFFKHCHFQWVSSIKCAKISPQNQRMMLVQSHYFFEAYDLYVNAFFWDGGDWC